MNTSSARQLTLFDIKSDNFNWKVERFSANALCEESARQALEDKYMGITEITDIFNRQSVSYQLSKRDCLHRWLKYKEGFSANLVETLFEEMEIGKGERVLDPFLGSGTTALVAQMQGINSIGFDIMPTTAVALFAKGNILRYNVQELHRLADFISGLNRPASYKKRVKSIAITHHAYPDQTERDIPFYTEQIAHSSFSDEAKGLARLCLLNSLERLSYTSKDGQYLRWAVNSKRVMEANACRIAAGREPLKAKLDKGDLPSVNQVLTGEINKAIDDIVYLQASMHNLSESTEMVFKQGSALVELPLLRKDTISGVVTSPPYCNRYDYTRIYALELAFLGMGEDEIRRTRQDLLSCTVENRTKLDFLHDYYNSMGRMVDFNRVKRVIKENAALSEVVSALKIRNDNGDINNKGILKMVKGYFEELAFVYYELFRVCKKGAKVAFVNDNVRYAGEVIPVDFISTELAAQFGFTPLKVYSLKQQKGNSSQQMAKFGRVPLRKSITLWEK
ncbi:MAG: site-specific DNA-methyltransferase [Coriobacteriales bacterium]|jgi:site-specific DNA-methyltransferase (cytosine-N4-specific)|nr:site-specific DNA-methyltransferase [Coriobacteriales bacterium]